MGKLAFKSLAELFLKNKKTPDVQIFQGLGLLPMPSLKKQEKSFARSEETIHKLKSKFSIFAKMSIIWPLTPTFGLGQSSISNIFANFDPLMANNSALKSSHQDGFDLGLLAAGRHNHKRNYKSRANRQ